MWLDENRSLDYKCDEMKLIQMGLKVSLRRFEVDGLGNRLEMHWDEMRLDYIKDE